MKTVLVTGGSGYLGQFIVQELGKRHKVGYTHYSTSLPKFEGCVEDFWVDLKTGEGLSECIEALGGVDVVVNCAAISQPALCEKDVEYARRCNVPTSLIAVLQEYKEKGGKEPLLVHLSTDQVYEGTKAWWKEDDPCDPVNAYGKLKREAEIVIKERWANHCVLSAVCMKGCTATEHNSCVQESWPHHCILRSSIIYGPQSPSPVSRSLFLQFIDNVLAEGKATTFFVDEFRSPIYVKDIVTIIDKLVTGHALKHRLFNMGGPGRLSRVDMAEIVAAKRRYDTSLIRPVPSASVNRGVASPPDISMNIVRLLEEFEMSPFTFEDALDDMKYAPVGAAAE